MQDKNSMVGIVGEMKSKNKLRLRLNMSHDSVYIDFNDFRCVFKEHGITCVYLVGKDEPIQCRDSVDEISDQVWQHYGQS